MPFLLSMMSDFDLIHEARMGNAQLVSNLIATERANRQNCSRVFSRCWNLFDLNHGQPNYWAAADFVVDEHERQGQRLCLVIFVDNYREVNGHMEPLLDHAQQDEWFELLTERYKSKQHIVWEIANEPEQKWQGFESAVDPRLFAYADRLAAKLGHRDFSIGAAPDGDNPDASKETIDQSREIARHCNLIDLHSSRKGHAYPEPNRVRRWVDHLEGFVDVIAECRHVNPHAHGIHKEPHGHASVKQVPIPGGVYEREDDAEMALAAAMTSVCCELSYCYHRIRTQDEGVPGLDLIGKCLADMPAGWRYQNDSWGDSATAGFTWEDGKVRCYIERGGPNARIVAYGSRGGTITMKNKYEITGALYDGSASTDGTACAVYTAVQR